MTNQEITRDIPDDSNTLKLELKQRMMEQAAHERARKRVEEQINKRNDKGREADGPVAGYLINATIGTLLEDVEQWIEKTTAASQENKRGAKPIEYGLLKHYHAMQEKGLLLEFVASSLGSCFNGITKGIPATSMAFDIAPRVEHLLMLEEARKADKKLFKQILNAAKGKKEERKRLGVVSFMTRVNNVNWEPWTQREKVDFGMHFLQLVADSRIGCFHLQMRYEKGKTIRFLALTAAASEKMNKGELHLLETASQYEPMIVPPVAWAEGIVSGAGYLTNAQMPLSMVKKTGRKYQRELAALRDPHMAIFYKGLNAAQSTGWRIRKPILALLQGMMKTGVSMGKIPALKLEDHQPTPATADMAKKLMKDWNSTKGDRAEWLAENLSEGEQRIVKSFDAWKGNEARIYKDNAELQGRWVGLTRNIATAQRLQEFESIYIPHQVDFRGRVYAATQGGLSPQGEDYSKALLEFDKGMALGKHGLFWLKWHTANVWGEDKLDHDERGGWTDEHMEMIRSCAMDPLQDRRWTDADKPFQFLACCIELNQALSMENPDDYVSHMPVALDGSCSGLQHLGMATRCWDTGVAVNLEGEYRPRDIYQIVADKVADALRVIAAGNKECKNENWKEHALKWIEWKQAWNGKKLSRKITKRPVMTYAYGAKEFGFGEQVMEDILDPAARKAAKERDITYPWADFGERNHAARLMAWLIWEAVLETVKIPAQMMKWLQEVANMTGKDSPLIWTTPLGFPVEQDNTKQDSVSIDCKLYGGKRFRYDYNADRPEQDMKERVNAIAPNVVHSLDATHLLMTVAAGMDEGIKHFALIHDSFGTHAANIRTLHRIVREKMVELYSEDYFKELRQELMQQVRPELQDQVPELPEWGDLDITELLNAEYAFA